MSRHTPGPWVLATSCSWRRFVNSRSEPVCVPTIQRHDNHPDLHFPNGGSDGPDARLIAAAPDMLEVLQELQRVWLEGIMHCEPSEYSKAHEAISGVIAQATGGYK